jgi:hypothetical protein
MKHLLFIFALFVAMAPLEAQFVPPSPDTITLTVDSTGKVVSFSVPTVINWNGNSISNVTTIQTQAVTSGAGLTVTAAANQDINLVTSGTGKAKANGSALLTSVTIGSNASAYLSYSSGTLDFQNLPNSNSGLVAYDIGGTITTLGDLDVSGNTNLNGDVQVADGQFFSTASGFSVDLYGEASATAFYTNDGGFALAGGASTSGDVFWFDTSSTYWNLPSLYSPGVDSVHVGNGVILTFDLNSNIADSSGGSLRTSLVPIIFVSDASHYTRGDGTYAVFSPVQSLSTAIPLTVGLNVFTGSTARTTPLPAPSSGGHVVVKNVSSATETISSNSGSQIFATGATSASASVTLTSGSATEFWSEGTDWYQK